MCTDFGLCAGSGFGTAPDIGGKLASLLGLASNATCYTYNDAVKSCLLDATCTTVDSNTAMCATVRLDGVDAGSSHIVDGPNAEVCMVLNLLSLCSSTAASDDADHASSPGYLRGTRI